METERLTIDAVTAADKADYFRHIAHDRRVLETFVSPYAESLEAFDFSPYLTLPGLFAIRLKETGRLIGVILHFDDTGPVCEMGYGIGAAYWNRGYATEAVERFLAYLLEEKGFRRVQAAHFAGDDASGRVMEKCGMTFSHIAEKGMAYLGREQDLVCYTYGQ